MDQNIPQSHYGGGDNVGGNKYVYNFIASSVNIKYDEVRQFQAPEPYFSRQVYKQENGQDVLKGIERPNHNIVDEIIKHRKIVLLGDAGIGKSTELKHLGYKMKELGYFPIFMKLATYPDPSELFIIDQQEKYSEDKIILLFDGLDEAKLDVAKLKIERFCDTYPLIKVIVSCRMNAYANTLDGFETYRLGTLTYHQVKNYLHNELGAFTDQFLEYWSNRYPFNPIQLIENPFFLIKICEYIRQNDNKTPNSLSDIFEFFISNALDLRLKNISQYGENNFEKKRESCKNSLEKLAFIMECKGENIISKADLYKVIPDDIERNELLGKSSLIEIESDSAWRFVHNNFQEYLAAKSLSRVKTIVNLKKVIASKPNFERLIISWSNTIFFYFEIVGGNLMKDQFYSWLSSNDHNLDSLIKIIALGNESHTGNFKYSLFRQVFLKHKQKEALKDSSIRIYDLAKLCDSPNGFDFLFAELSNSKIDVSLKNDIFQILKHLSKSNMPISLSKGYKKVLSDSINTSQPNFSSAKHLAIDALSNLFILPDNEAVEIANRFFYSNNSNELRATYSLISHQKIQKHFLEPLIKRELRIEERLRTANESRVIWNESWYIEKCFEEIDEEEVIMQYFKAYTELTKSFTDHNYRTLKIMVKKIVTTTISQDSAYQILNMMNESFASSFRLFYFPNNVGYENLMHEFILKYGLRLDLLKYCCKNQHSIAIIQLLEHDYIEDLARYTVESNDKEWITGNLLFWCKKMKNELLEALIKAINKCAQYSVSETDIPQPKERERSDYEVAFHEKELVFNSEKIKAAVVDVFNVVGKNFLDKNEFFELDYTVYDRLEQQHTPLIMRLISRLLPITNEEISDWVVRNWDDEYMFEIRDYLTNNKKLIEQNAALGLSEEERGKIISWCNDHVAKINWNDLTEKDLVFAWFVIYLGLTHYNEDLYLNILTSNLQSDLGTEMSVIDFLLEKKNIAIKRATDEFLKMLQRGGYSNTSLQLILGFIKKNIVKDALPFIPAIVENYYGNTGNWGQNKALETYIHLNGPVDYLHKLLSKLNNCQSDYDRREIILLEYFSQNPDYVSEQIIIDKMHNSIQPKQKLKYSQCLFKMDSIKGLEFLVEYVKTERKSSLEDSYFGYTFDFENPKGLRLLLELLNYEVEISTGDHSFRAKSTLTNALSHLASCQNGKYFTQITKAIRKYIKWNIFLTKFPRPLVKLLNIANTKTIDLLRYKLRDIEIQHYYKQEISLDQAISLWNKIPK